MAAASVVALAKSIELCRGFGPDEIDSLVFRLNGVRKSYAKGDAVVHAGMRADRLLAVVSGRLHVYQRVLDDREVTRRKDIEGVFIFSNWENHIRIARREKGFPVEKIQGQAR